MPSAQWSDFALTALFDQADTAAAATAAATAQTAEATADAAAASSNANATVANRVAPLDLSSLLHSSPVLPPASAPAVSGLFAHELPPFDSQAQSAEAEQTNQPSQQTPMPPSTGSQSARAPSARRGLRKSAPAAAASQCTRCRRMVQPDAAAASTAAAAGVIAASSSAAVSASSTPRGLSLRPGSATARGAVAQEEKTAAWSATAAPQPSGIRPTPPQSQSRPATATAGGRSAVAATKAAPVLCHHCAAIVDSRAPAQPMISLSATPLPVAQIAAPQSAMTPRSVSMQLQQTMQRFNQPLTAQQARRHTIDQAVAIVTAQSVAADVAAPSSPAAPAVSPSPYHPSPAPFLATVAAHRDARSLCLALASAEKLAWSRAVEVELVRRQLAAALTAQAQAEERASATLDLGDTLREGAKERVRELSTLRSEASQARRNMASLSGEHARLHSEYEHLKSIWQSLRDELEKLAREHEDNIADKLAIRAQLDDLQLEHAALKAAHESVGPARAELEASHKTLSDEVAQLRLALHKSEGALESLQPKLDAAHRRADFTSKMADQQAEELVALKQQHAQLAATHAHLHAEHSKLLFVADASAAEVARLIESRAAMAAALSSSTGQVDRDRLLNESAAMDERARAQRAVHEAEESAKRAQVATLELVETKQAAISAQAKEQLVTDQLRTTQREREDLRSQVAALQQTNGAQQATCAAQVERITRLRSDLSEARSARTEAEANATLWRNQQQALALQRSAQMAAAAEVAKSLKLAQMAYNRVQSEAEARAQSSKTAIEDLRTRLAQNAHDLAEARASRADDAADRRAALADSKHAHARAIAATEKLSKLQAKYDSLSGIHASCAGGANVADALRRKVAAAEGKIATLQSKLANQTRIMQQAQAEAAKLTARIAAESGVRRDTASALASAQALARTQVAQVESAAARVEAARREMESERDRASAAARELSKAKRSLADFSREKHDLETRMGAQLHVSQQSEATLRDQLGAWQTKSEEAESKLKSQLLLVQQLQDKAGSSSKAAPADSPVVAAAAPPPVPAPRSSRASLRSSGGWSVPLAEAHATSNPVALFGLNDPRTEAERNAASMRAQIEELAEQMLQAREDKAAYQHAIEQATDATRVAEKLALQRAETIASLQSDLDRARAIATLEVNEAAAARLKVQGSSSVLSDQLDQTQRQLDAANAMIALLREQRALEAHKVTGYDEQQLATAAAVAKEAADRASGLQTPLELCEERAVRAETRLAESQSLVTQLSTKVRELSRARDRAHLQMIQDTEADYLRMQAADDAMAGGDPSRPGLPSEFSSGVPDIHYLYKTARQQLLRVAEQSKAAAERHQAISDLANEKHAAELESLREMQSSLLAQLSELRVSHGEELAALRNKLSRQHAIGLAVGKLYAEIRPQLGFTFLAESASLIRNHGLVVTAVAPDLGAHNAGLRVGDVIEEVAEVPIKQADDCVRAICTVRAGQRCSLYVRRVIVGSASSTDDSAPRVQYLRLSVLTHNAQYTAHQLSLLRRYARDPGDVADGDSDAAAAADEQLLSLMLTADRDRRMDEIMGIRSNASKSLFSPQAAAPFAIPAATQMAMRSRRMSLIVQSAPVAPAVASMGEMQSA